MKTKIAVPYEKGEIYQHFGHTEAFQFYTVEDGKVLDTKLVPTNGSGHGLLADFLLLNGASVVICGGIGGGAKTALAEKGIALRGGVSGNADERVAEYLNGTLEYHAAAECNHHDHHEEGHHCGGSCH
ncbi:MAG: NifB/NifX family molybdenum-iron cluster-binding protein [Anaerotignum sp.]|nr:NifB/NifX family molybdenum-iron cluster-binding protein [Anaerotignum sp.]